MRAGVSASRDSLGDTYSKTFKCHASNGGFLSPIRNSIFPPEADSIQTTLETWANTVFYPEQYFLSEGG